VAHKQILLPHVVALEMQIAMLKRELAMLQAQLLQMSVESEHVAQVTRLLTDAGIVVPVPLAQCGFDAEHGALTYEEPEALPTRPQPPAGLAAVMSPQP
jgi:hypothetical protein